MTRRCGDPEGTFWAVGDRGPNIKVKVAVGTLGLEHLAEHVDLDGANDLVRVLAHLLQVSPSFSLRGGTREVLRGIIARGLGLR